MEDGRWKICPIHYFPFSIFHLPLKWGEGKGEGHSLPTIISEEPKKI